MNVETGLDVDGVVRRYDSFALGPVSFRLARGRALGLLGPNGAGKSTLLAALAGQGRVAEGRIAWDGRPVVRGDWHHRQWIGYVRDVPALYDELTVAQTVAFVAALHPTWQAARAGELIERFRLGARQRVRALSRGMKTKLGLLLAVSHDVQLLLLDEVTAGVDAETRDDVQRFLRALVQDRGVAVILSSHLFEDVERVSDDVLILRAGRPAYHGGLAALGGPGAGGPALRELYFGRGDA